MKVSIKIFSYKFLFFIMWFNVVGFLLALEQGQKGPLLSSIKEINTTTSIAPNEYTINLMWINRKLKKDQRYIYPAFDEKELRKKILCPIFKWAALHGGSIVCLWFDSALTPSKAVENTERLIVEYVQKHPESACIVLRDVRDLSSVINNPEVFSEKTPVFFRVDLLRIIAQVSDISMGVTSYFVYSDLDIGPFLREEIFDEKTLRNLQNFGIVMMYHPTWQGFENGFSIVSNHNPYLLEALADVQVELNIQRAYHALKGKFYKSEHLVELIPVIEKYKNNKLDDCHMLQQFIFHHNYSVNILWLNDKLREQQQYIHPGGNDEELQDYFFQPIFKWAAMNQTGQINLWFDSITTSIIAVNNTRQFIRDNHPELTNIVLRDVRELPYVQKHSKLFLSKNHEFKNELLQVLTAMFDISTGRTSYCIFGSLLELEEYKDLFDLKSIAAQDLFDEQSVKDLQKFGITVACKGGITKGIIGGNIRGLFEFLESEWIEPNNKKAYEKLYGIDCCDECCVSMSRLQQIIWASYPNMFKYFYHLAGFGKLIVENFDQQSGQFFSHEYNKTQDGLMPFGINRFISEINFDAFAQLQVPSIGQVWIPTKKIAHAKPTLSYEDEDPVRSVSDLATNKIQRIHVY